MDSTNGARGILSSAVVDLPPGDEGALITSVETYALAVPLVKTIADSTASIPAWIVPVVELHTADRAPLRRHRPVLRARVDRSIVARHRRYMEAPVLATDTLDRPGRCRSHGSRNG